jgi:hypothetical protein
MKKIFTGICFSFTTLLGLAQFSDNFSDGNFTANPGWIGNDTDFIVNPAFQLQLNSTGTDTSYLATANTNSLNGCEWNFWIRLNFAPSSNNNGRVYLVSDQQNLSGPLNGYYLQFGEALSNDQVELFRQTGTSSVSVCRGTTLIAAAFSIRVKVTRDNSGNWSLLIDPTGGVNYQLEASGTDNTFTSTSFFGLKCTYTTTNANDFYLDDIYVGPIVVDLVPPSVYSLSVISANELDVFFSEPVEITSAENELNYSASNGLGNPLSALRDGVNSSLVHLTFSNNFQDATINVLTTSGVEDLPGNVMTAENDTFYYYIPKNFDVLINEIMADPSPQVLLPDYEYVELKNTSLFPISLVNWTITIGSNTKIISGGVIPPDSFIVLTSTTGAPFFTGINVFGVTSFPSVTNTGNTIIIRDSLGRQIHSVTYSDSWYRDVVKADGGYSLELIDGNNPCGDAMNWIASNDISGGTPGRENSVNGSLPDLIKPELLRISVIAPYDTIQVFFSESLDTTAWQLSGFNIDNGIGTPVQFDLIAPGFTSVKLKLGSVLQSGIIYTLTVNFAFQDCAGNTMLIPATAKFAIPQPCLPGDIVLNEILADPLDNGVEWVEIYNRSSKVIDLGTLSLCKVDTITGVLSDIRVISTTGFLIFPGEYYVLSSNGAIVRGQYATLNAKAFLDMSSIPSLTNDGAVIAIITNTQTIIDQVAYSIDWHFPLLNSMKGVSLERINFDRPSQDKTNWHSASEGVGYATPGYLNSQFSDDAGSGEVVVIPEIFSPDNDGYNDVVNINYTFDKPGYVATIRIYDSRGRLTRTLINNELLGTSGTFSWDGISDVHTKAPIGIFVILLEAYNTEGDVKKFKRACVVGTKL